MKKITLAIVDLSIGGIGVESEHMLKKGDKLSLVTLNGVVSFKVDSINNLTENTYRYSLVCTKNNEFLYSLINDNSFDYFEKLAS